MKTMKDQSFELDLLNFHGESLDLEFEIPGAGAPWILEDVEAAIKIDEDESFCVDLTAQLIDSTVHLDGHIKGTFYYRCGRCLEWRELDLDESVQFVLMSRPSWEQAYGDEDEIVLDEADLDVSYYDDEIIDLRPLLREAVLLQMPDFPACPDALKEACDTAYERVVGEEVLESNEENSIDLRWSKLKEIELDDDDT